MFNSTLKSGFCTRFHANACLKLCFLYFLFERYQGVDDILPKDVFQNFGQLKNSNESVNVNQQSEERHLEMQKEREK